MNVAVLIPDRGDRPEFLDQCLKLMDKQTLKPCEILIKNEPAIDNSVDITRRYREGYEQLSKTDCEVIAFIENDDWYHPHYLEVMAKKWDELGRPIIFGTNFTIYYHLRLQRYFRMYHDQRSSAMNTFIRPRIPGIEWGVESNPYTDMVLWEHLYKKGGKVWAPDQVLCVGMKHGIGKTGGFCHVDSLERFENPDGGFLFNTIGADDPNSYEFYLKFKEE